MEPQPSFLEKEEFYEKISYSQGEWELTSPPFTATGLASQRYFS
jgi:hypothetical protein